MSEKPATDTPSDATPRTDAQADDTQHAAEQDRITTPPPKEAQDHEEHTAPPGAFYVHEHPKHPNDIAFVVLRADPSVDLLELKSEIEKTLSALKILYKGDQLKFRQAFDKLLGLAQVGLSGGTPAPGVARGALASLKAEVVDQEAGRIKNRYLVRLGGWALFFCALTLFLRLLIAIFPQTGALSFASTHANFLLLVAGCMVGVWLSFGARRVTLEFYDLIRVEDDQLEPWLRLIFAGLLTHLLALMVITGIFDLNVGTFSVSQLLQSGAVAFLLGGICGLSEKALPSALLQRASSILEGVAKRQ